MSQLRSISTEPVKTFRYELPHCTESRRRVSQLCALAPAAWRYWQRCAGPRRGSVASPRNFVDYLYVLDAKLLGPPRQEFIELRLGGPDNLVLEYLYQPVD